QPLAALGAVLAEQGQQRLLLRQNAFQTREVAFAQGGKLLIGELKQLAGYADIVGKLVKQGRVLHFGLLDVLASVVRSGSALRLEGEQLGGDALAVDLIGAVGNRLPELGYTLLIDGGLFVQLVGCLLQALGLWAQLYRIAGAGAGVAG